MWKATDNAFVMVEFCWANSICKSKVLAEISIGNQQIMNIKLFLNCDFSSL
jgi:hypothetical protein